MPVYVFKCSECEAVFEKRLPYGHADEQVTCPKGHHLVRRVYTSPSVVYKGSGFYSTDHPRTRQNHSS